MITFTLSAPTLSPNERQRMIRWDYARHRTAMANEIMAKTAGQRPLFPYAGARIEVVRHSAGMLDSDNLVGSLKTLLDVLQPASSRCPSGLGIIANDSAAALTIEASQLVCKRGMGKTVVTITETKETPDGAR